MFTSRNRWVRELSDASQIIRSIAQLSGLVLVAMVMLTCWEPQARASSSDSVDLQVLSTSIASDSSGNIYYADTAHGNIYKVSSSGEQTEILCCAGTDAKLNQPRGLALNNQGDLYVANTGNNQVLKINSSAQASVINTGFYNLSRPAGVAIDANGDIYIADSGNSRIVEVAASGGQTSLVDTGSYKLSNPSSVFVDQNNTLYIADTENDRIVSVPATGPSKVLFLDQLRGPLSMTVDGDGNAYIAQTAGYVPSQDNSDNGIPAIVSSFSVMNMNVSDGGGSQGAIASANVTLTPMGGFHGTVYLSVVGLPPNVMMQMTHPIVTFQEGRPVANVLKIGESKTAQQSHFAVEGRLQRANQRQWTDVAMAGLLPISFLLLLGFGSSSRKLARSCKILGIITLLLILPILTMSTFGCAGGYPAGLFGNSTYTATLIAKPANGQPYSLGSFGITVLK